MVVFGMLVYCGSKFVLEGMFEVLGKEVVQFGIYVTVIEFGSFWMDWVGCFMTRVEYFIEDYDELFGPIRAARRKVSGN